MPMVAETAVTQGLRGDTFIDAIEGGHTALLQVADRFCFTGEGDFTASAEYAVRAALTVQD